MNISIVQEGIYGADCFKPKNHLLYGKLGTIAGGRSKGCFAEPLSPASLLIAFKRSPLTKRF
jgi:hypothetical protein